MGLRHKEATDGLSSCLLVLGDHQNVLLVFPVALTFLLLSDGSSLSHSWIPREASQLQWLQQRQ